MCGPAGWPGGGADQATYSASTRTTTGIRHVLVNGTFVVRDAQLARDALAGDPSARPIPDGDIEDAEVAELPVTAHMP